MSAELYEIATREDAVLDTGRIVVLRQSLGDQRCREVVSEVVFHLTDRLGLLQAALDGGDVAEAQTLASRLASLSEQVGLKDFARVARDLDDCLARRRPGGDGGGRGAAHPARARNRSFRLSSTPINRLCNRSLRTDRIAGSDPKDMQIAADHRA